ncbi:MAG: class I SAM-dependent methyltransferase [Planctomycetota bacterium]
MTEPVEIYTTEYYDRLKAVEANHWWTLGMTDIMHTLLAARLPQGENVTFLDVGCGSGIGLAWAARNLPHARRIGVDVSPHALEHCESTDAELHLVEDERLPLRDTSVDLAICIDVLQHTADETAMLSEVFRVLKPGGVLFARTNARSITPPPAGSRLFTRSELVHELKEAGFRVLRCSPTNAVGSVVAEVDLWREHRRRQRSATPTSTIHGPTSSHGGGYGGGLRLSPEDPRRLTSRAKRTLLKLEGFWIRCGGRLPFGHSLVALACREPSDT